MSYQISWALALLPMFSVLLIVIQQKHLLMTLLSLESAVLALVLVSCMLLGTPEHSNLFIITLLLTFGACEASLGLSLLVSMSRQYGSDLIKSVSSLKC